MTIMEAIAMVTMTVVETMTAMETMTATETMIVTKIMTVVVIKMRYANDAHEYPADDEES